MAYSLVEILNDIYDADTQSLRILPEDREGMERLLYSTIEIFNDVYDPETHRLRVSDTTASGFSNPMTTLGDIIIAASGGTAQRLAIGSNTTVLTVTDGLPAWEIPTGESSTGAFRASHAQSTVIAHNTITKMALTVEGLDTGGYFDNATNYRWTPPSGIVHLTGRISWSACSQWGTFTYIYKNGVLLASTRCGINSLDQSVEVNTHDLASGTDYYELFAHQISGGDLTCTGASFSGIFVE
jgi:hypothetical protein